MQIEFPSVDRLRARRGSKWNRFPTDVLPVTPAESDFAPCQAVEDALRDWLRRQSYGYPLRSNGGPADALRHAFGRRMRVAFDWAPDLHATQIVTSGSQGLAACVHAYSAPGDGVAFHTPAFPAIPSIIAEMGRAPLPNRMLEDEGRFVLGEACPQSTGARMFVLCHPHNPTGRAFGKGELDALARWVDHQGAVVVSDELHADTMLDGRRHVPFARLFPDLAERVVTLCSPSKAFGLGGLGCAVLHFGSPELETRFRAEIAPDLLGEASVPSLVASEAAWTSGDSWLRSASELVERNRDRFIGESESVGTAIRAYRSEATFFLWVDLRGAFEGGRPCDKLLREGRVAAADGARFGDGFDGFVRFVIATSPERVDELMERLFVAVRSGHLGR